MPSPVCACGIEYRPPPRSPAVSVNRLHPASPAGRGVTLCSLVIEFCCCFMCFVPPPPPSGRSNPPRTASLVFEHQGFRRPWLLYPYRDYQSVTGTGSPGGRVWKGRRRSKKHLSVIPETKNKKQKQKTTPQIPNPRVLPPLIQLHTHSPAR